MSLKIFEEQRKLLMQLGHLDRLIKYVESRKTEYAGHVKSIANMMSWGLTEEGYEFWAEINSILHTNCGILNMTRAEIKDRLLKANSYAAYKKPIILT